MFFIWAGTSVQSPRKYSLFSLPKMVFTGSKYPKNLTFHSVNKMTDVGAWRERTGCSVSVLADMSVTPPQKSFTLMISYIFLWDGSIPKIFNYKLKTKWLTGCFELARKSRCQFELSFACLCADRVFGLGVLQFLWHDTVGQDISKIIFIIKNCIYRIKVSIFLIQAHFPVILDYTSDIWARRNHLRSM